MSDTASNSSVEPVEQLSNNGTDSAIKPDTPESEIPEATAEDPKPKAQTEVPEADADAEDEEGDDDVKVEEATGEEATEEEEDVPGPDAPILEAAETGDHAKLVKILDEDKNQVKARNANGETPLHLVTKDCYVVCAQLLIRAGAELDAQDKDGKTPLHLAILHGSLDVIDTLLEQGASPMVTDNDGMNALHTSAVMGLSRVAEVLLMDMDFKDHEADEDKEEGEELCPKCWGAPQLDDPVENVEQRPPCDHPFHLTEQRDQTKRLPVDKVQLLKTVDSTGRTPLHITAAEPDYSSLSLEFLGVLKEEIPDSYMDIISMKDDDGLQPLHIACMAANTEVIGEMLDMGADPTAMTPDCENCFHISVGVGYFPALYNILQCREQMEEAWVPFLNSLNKDGENVMHIACKYGHERIVLELLRHRNALDINLPNNAGETPAVKAYKEGYEHVCNIMCANGVLPSTNPALPPVNPVLESVLAAKADDEAKGIVREVKGGDFTGQGPGQQKTNYAPLLCVMFMMIFGGPYVFGIIDRLF